jgi:hypothetical protein
VLVASAHAVFFMQILFVQQRPMRQKEEDVQKKRWKHEQSQPKKCVKKRQKQELNQVMGIETTKKGKCVQVCTSL